MNRIRILPVLLVLFLANFSGVPGAVHASAGGMHSVILFNQSATRLGFYYYTYCNEPVEFYAEPGKSVRILLDSPVWVTQLTPFQTPYLLDGQVDSLTIHTDVRGIAILFPSRGGTATKANDLRAFEYVSLHVKKTENAVLLDILRSKNYQDIDRIITTRYMLSRSLLQEFEKEHLVSDAFSRRAEELLRLQLYNYELYWIGNAKQQLVVPPAYQDYLDSVGRLLLSGALPVGQGSPSYKTDFDFFCRQCRQRARTACSTGRLYQAARKDIKAEDKRNKILFFLVKEEVANRRSYDTLLVRQFYQECTDEQYKGFIAAQIADKVLLESGQAVDMRGDVLVTASRGKLSFRDVLQQNRGKVIYIDTWASWCAPCREQMPASRRLRSQFSGLPVSFLYISADVSLKAWTEACVQEKLDQYSGSYLMADFERSAFRKNYSISAIPHYILIDRQGKLIRGNAPGPDDPGLPDLIRSASRQ